MLARRWVTEEAVVECREALACPAARDEALVLRRFVAVEGRARVRVQVELARAYGTARGTIAARDETGAWTLAAGAVRGHLLGAADARVRDGRLKLELSLAQGGHHDLALAVAHGRDPDVTDPTRAWSRGTRAGTARRRRALHHRSAS